MTRKITVIFEMTGNEYFDHVTGEFNKPTLQDDIQLALDIINHAFTTNESYDVANAKFYITDDKTILHLSQTITPDCNKDE